MTAIYKRPVSLNERLWIVADRLNSPYVNQMVLEGKGSPSLTELKKAVETASEANPGSRVVHKGVFGFSYWKDSGKSPGIREVDGTSWNGYSPDNAPFLLDPLDPFKGPACEVLTVKGNPHRLIFRTHHAIMDGRGTMVWVDDIFKALNGEKPLGSWSRLTDQKLGRYFNTEKRKPYPYEHIAPTGFAQGTRQGTTWRRKKISGNFSLLLPRIALLMAKEAWSCQDGRVRMTVSVDLRPRVKGLRSTGNLTSVLYLEIDKTTSASDIADCMTEQMNKYMDCMFHKGNYIVGILPIKSMCRWGKKEIPVVHSSGKYRISGLLSNLGRIQVETFCGGGFKAESCFFIPPSLDSIPYFTTFTGNIDSVDIVTTMPEVLASNGRIENIMQKIEDELNRKK